MITETAFQWKGLADARTFREDFRFRSHTIEDDAGLMRPAVSMQYPPLGMSADLDAADEKTLLATAQSVLDEWIARFNTWHREQENIRSVDRLRHRWETLLTESLAQNHLVDLDRLRNNIQFTDSEIHTSLRQKKDAIPHPAMPVMGFIPPKPVYHEPEIQFKDRLLLRKALLIRLSEEEYTRKLDTWDKICNRIREHHEAQVAEYTEAVRRTEEMQESVEREIAEARMAYEELQRQQNEAVDILRINYQGGQPEAVERFLQRGLEQSDLPDPLPRNLELEYQRDSRALYVAMELPHPTAIPRAKSAAVDANTQQIRVTEYTPVEHAMLYNDIVHKLILRCFHDIFASDEAGVVDAISYHGWVRTLNRGNGQYENVCIATLFCTREEFSGINLAQVDPALCFRYLKGVSGPSFHELTPIPTRFTISKKTREQVPAHRQLEPLDGGKNLSLVSWPEFETMVLDIFTRELGKDNMELKRLAGGQDNGLEALAIDPDPLRGGTYLLHAHRSLEPLGLSAVRALYGAMMHEGAVKGILATTGEFTPEALAFARQKPLSLVDGKALQDLFEKHGRQVRVKRGESLMIKEQV
jgi:restriction system protein